MVFLDKSMFREYDIRGIADTQLSDEVVELIGKAYGTFIGGKEVIIAMDNRKSSERIKNALIKGLISCGCEIIDIGLSIVPILYFARKHYGIDGGIMITASHNPKEYNGFKICKGFATIFGDDIQKLRRIAEEGKFLERSCGQVRYEDPKEAYYDLLKEKIKLNKKFKVVVDCGNGTASLFAADVLRNWGCEVVELYCDSDPDFPNHQPDPVKLSCVQDLIKLVKEHNADLGVGFDGDGDRLGVVDNEGNMIWGDMMLVLFFRELLAKYPGEECIIEVKCSQSLVDDVRAHGGNPVFFKTGHSLIKDKMIKDDAKLAGEMSGHMFFRDEFIGTDDAFYAAGRLLRIMDKSNKKLSELFLDVPKYYSTPEMRLYCPDEYKFDITKQIVEYFKDNDVEGKKDVIDVDGVRIVFNDGWALVRTSNTQPALIFRCEGVSEEAKERIKKLMFAKLKDYPEISLEE